MKLIQKPCSLTEVLREGARKMLAKAPKLKQKSLSINTTLQKMREDAELLFVIALERDIPTKSGLIPASVHE